MYILAESVNVIVLRFPHAMFVSVKQCFGASVDHVHTNARRSTHSSGISYSTVILTYTYDQIVFWDQGIQSHLVFS